MLHVQVERTVGVELQRVTVANGKAFDGVGREVAIFVVQGKRPEGLYGISFF